MKYNPEDLGYEEEIDPEFQRGFNDGYTIISKFPDFSDLIDVDATSKGSNQYIIGYSKGIEEHEMEQLQHREDQLGSLRETLDGPEKEFNNELEK